MHQRRLLPLLARTYALHFAQAELVDDFVRVFGGRRHDEHDRRALEAQAAGTKALGTWHATETIQMCREACGGAGYLAENRLATLKADTDVFTTFEGDNTVLLQLVAKGLLTDYRESFGRARPARHRAVRRGAGGRDRGREDCRCARWSSGCATSYRTGPTAADPDAGLGTTSTTAACCGSARSTCWPAWPGG